MRSNTPEINIRHNIIRKDSLSYDSELERRLKEYNVSVEIGDQNEFQGRIPAETPVSDRSFVPNISTPENAAVICETRASFCSIIFAIDKRGTVVSIHKPLIDHPTSEIKDLLDKSGFSAAVDSILLPDHFYFVTGTNVPQDEQEEFIQKLQHVFPREFSFLFIKQSQEESNFLHGLIEKRVRDEKKSSALISAATMIPSSVSTDGKIQILLPTG